MDTLLQLHNKGVGKSMKPKQLRSRFLRAEPAASDFRCAGCGYQIAIAEPHPVCPMCGLGSWAPVTAARELARTDADAFARRRVDRVALDCAHEQPRATSKPSPRIS